MICPHDRGTQKLNHNLCLLGLKNLIVEEKKTVSAIENLLGNKHCSTWKSFIYSLEESIT